MATARRKSKPRKSLGAKRSKPVQKLNSGLAAYNARRAALKHSQKQQSSKRSFVRRSPKSTKARKAFAGSTTTATASRISNTHDKVAVGVGGPQTKEKVLIYYKQLGIRDIGTGVY